MTLKGIGSLPKILSIGIGSLQSLVLVLGPYNPWYWYWVPTILGIGIGCLQSSVLVLGPYIGLHTECGRRHVRMSGNTSQHDDDDDALIQNG